MLSLPARTLFIALVIGLAHVVSGLAVTVAPDALLSTPLALMHRLVYVWFEHATGLMLIGVGVTAMLAGLRVGDAKLQLIMILPQQGILFLQIWSISSALATGTYPDGYEPHGGAWFILADQIWAWLFAVIHTLEVVGLLIRKVAK